MVDGEIVIATRRGLDFDALQLRLHPAASRVEKLAKETPASFVAFDLLAVGGRNLMRAAGRATRGTGEAARERRGLCTSHPSRATARLRSTGCSASKEPVSTASSPSWSRDVPAGQTRDDQGQARAHGRMCRCGIPLAQERQGRGGLAAAGLYDARRAPARRSHFVLHDGDAEGNSQRSSPHCARTRWPSIHGANGQAPPPTSTPDAGAQSRWSAGKDLSWEPLRIERVCEVKYDHMQGDRFRHAAQFLRWRPDKRPEDCRYDQLEVTRPYELERIFSASR